MPFTGVSVLPYFTPPSVEYSYPTSERLWQFFRTAAHGQSIIRWQDGTYSKVETLTTDEEAEASFIYYGGHIYQISQTEADALTAAGYGDGVTDSSGGGGSGYGSGPYGSGGYGG